MANKIKTVISDVGTKFKPTILEIARCGLPDDSNIIYEGLRNRLGVVGDNLNIKAFGQPKFPNNVVHTGIRKSKARRSYEHALKLLDLGFAPPLPYGYAEEITSPVPGIKTLHHSYYFSQQVQMPNMRFGESNPDLLVARVYADASGKDEREVVKTVKRIFRRFNRR